MRLDHRCVVQLVIRLSGAGHTVPVERCGAASRPGPWRRSDVRAGGTAFERLPLR